MVYARKALLCHSAVKMSSLLYEPPSCLRSYSSGSIIFRNPQTTPRHAMSLTLPKTWPQTVSALPLFMSGKRRDLSTSAALQARLIQRPQRPYQFTQLVQLSDGSTFTIRTTSPQPLHRCTKDSRNHIIWQPSEKSLHDVEVDEAGRLAAFRSRFGRSWDAASNESGQDTSPAHPDNTKQASGSTSPNMSGEFSGTLTDLLSGYAAKEEPSERGGLSAKDQAKVDKSKKK